MGSERFYLVERQGGFSIRRKADNKIHGRDYETICWITKIHPATSTSHVGDPRKKADMVLKALKLLEASREG